jgi:peptidoglycan/LPS O-acetylase OafA/YrhL
MNTQTIDLPVQAGTQTQAVTTQAVRTTSSRLAYLDTLRAVLCVLVILLHTAITYGAMGDWTFVDHTASDKLASILLTLFVILCQGFFMGLFFFISGYLIPGSIDRKGLESFWKDRLLRLGLPLLVFTLLLSKVPNYLSLMRYGKTHLSFLEFCLTRFWQSADAGPTWFLFALLVFSAGYSLWRLAASRWMRRSGAAALAFSLPTPRTGAVLAFALAIAAGMWGVCQVSPFTHSYRLFNSITLLWSFFPQYILMFAAGILAYRNNWLANLPGKARRFWAGLTAFLAVALLALFYFGGAASGQIDAFFSGLHWQSIALNLWVGLYSVSISMALLLWLRDRRPSRSPLMAAVSASTFSTYLIHPLLLVPISFALSYIVFHPLAKFALVAVLAVTISFAIGIALRRIPGLKAIL